MDNVEGAKFMASCRTIIYSVFVVNSALCFVTNKTLKSQLRLFFFIARNLFLNNKYVKTQMKDNTYISCCLSVHQMITFNTLINQSFLQVFLD